MSSTLSVGASALLAAQTGLTVTGHNIANVNTPGYSRQRVIQGSVIADGSGGTMVGKGTQVKGVERTYDEFLVSQTRDVDSQLATSQALARQLERLANVMGNDETGLGTAITEFYGTAQDVATRPGDGTTRATMLAAANTLTERFRSLDTTLARSRQDVNGQIMASVNDVNSLANQVASLNTQIKTARNTGQEPNDLLDQRDQSLRELSRFARVTVLEQNDGTSNIFLSNGQALVVGGAFQMVSVNSDPARGDDFTLNVTNESGDLVYVRPETLGGGTIAGLFQARDAIGQAQNEVGRLAQVMAATVNGQHRLGVDRNGQPGGDLFVVGAPAAAAFGNNPSGLSVSMSVAIADARAMKASDYKVTYDGGQYVVERLSDKQVSTFATMPQTIDGLTLAITGAPQLGDRFLVQATRGAADFALAMSDPARIAAASPVRASQSSANFGDARISAPVVEGPALDSNVQQPVTITFTGSGQFNVTGTGTGNPTGVAFTSGGAISYNGWTVQITGTPRAGDTFTIGPNTGGVGDGTNMVAIAAQATQGVVEGQRLAESYGSAVADIGFKARAAQSLERSQTALLTSAEQAQAAVSGVNLEEEAANLLKYQQAYQAAARYMAIAGRLFDELASIGR